MIIKLYDEFYFINIDLIKGQFDIFGGEAKKVQKPGSRGGQFWIDEKGNVRYDERPKGISKKKLRAEKEKRLLEEIKAKKGKAEAKAEEKDPWEMKQEDYVKIGAEKIRKERLDEADRIERGEQEPFEIWGTKDRKVAVKQLRNMYEDEPYNKIVDVNSFRMNHRLQVKRALSEGKDVPQKVLDDYPELKNKKEKPEAKRPKKEFKTIDDLNDWYTKLSKQEQGEQKDFYQQQFDEIIKQGIDELMAAVEKENLDYLKALGYDQNTIDRMTAKTKNEIVDKHLSAEKVSVLQDGGYKIVNRQETEKSSKSSQNYQWKEGNFSKYNQYLTHGDYNVEIGRTLGTFKHHYEKNSYYIYISKKRMIDKGVKVDDDVLNIEFKGTLNRAKKNAEELLEEIIKNGIKNKDQMEKYLQISSTKKPITGMVINLSKLQREIMA